MGEFRVHRARFFDYTPLAIQCMAYNAPDKKLALSRSDGSIELWNAKENWYQEEVIPGGEGNSVEALVWQGSRLFTAGLGGDITEIDLLKLQPKASCSSNAGPVWCLTSNPSGTKLAAGTEDGCVVLLDTENDQLEYSRRFDAQESRILCVAWNKTEDIIVTGGIDNVRLWSVSSGRAIQRLTVGRQEKNKETVVWCLTVLSDMTIVSGDSRGKTTFWNGKQGTVIKSIQSHKADVYCLAVDPSETAVITSGVDSTLVQFSFVPARENSDWRDWVATVVHHQHTHDVRAMQIVDGAVVSGGVDTSMIHYILKRKDDRQLVWKRIRPIPHRNLVKVAKSKNILLLQYPGRLEVWRLGHTDSHGGNGDILPLGSNILKLVEFKTKGGSPVYCCDISHDASLLAYSDCDTVRLYKLNIANLTAIQPAVSMKRVSANQESPPDGAHCMCFTGDGRSLVTVTSSSRLQVLAVGGSTVSVVHTFPPKSDSIHLLSLSPDDRLAAVADHNCNVHIYNLQTKQYVCSVPRQSCQVSALSFSPDSDLLALVYTNQMIYEFSMSDEEYSDWSKRTCQRFMKTWLKRASKITRIMYNPANPCQLVMNDEQMFCILDKTQPFPRNSSWQNLCTPSPETPTAFHICVKYKFLMHLEVLPNNWLIVVERPPLEMDASLPDALKKKKFGT